MSPAANPDDRAKQRAEALFQTGNDATLKSNFDYAIDMYRNALKLDPANLLYRQALRGVERRKFGNDPAKVSRLVGARNQPIRMRARSAISKGKHAEAIEICEEAFIHNPWDVSAAQEAAAAAEALELPELARWLLESVVAVAESDPAFLRLLAHVYQINEDWGKAITCWERIQKLVPTDDDARRQIKALSASQTITRSGLHNAISKSDETRMANEMAVAAELDGLKSQSVTPEQRWRNEIEEDPTRVGPYLELADHLKLHNRLDEAEKILAKGVKAMPDEELIRSAHAEIQIARLGRAIAVWEKKVRESPDDAASVAKLDQLRTMRDDYELKEFRRRVAARPDDHAGRFQLGLRLARAGLHDEAIAEFQQARNSAAYKVEALHQVGRSFEAKGLPKLAERNYQEALKHADPSDESLRKALYYRLGRATEAMGDFKAAEEHYNEVAAADYTYLDVAERLTSLNRKADS